MKEIELKDGLTVKEFCDHFKKQSEELMPGEWKLVGIKIFLLNEDDICASPGIYSKGFDSKEYEGET